MLTDGELKQLFKYYNVKCQGIFLKDKLKNKTIKQGFYVYNLDSANNPVSDTTLGTHWTCSVGNENHVVYFDSFGVLPPMEIHKFLKSDYPKYAYNNYIIQDISSTACGLYCLGLALFVKQFQTTYPNLIQCCNEYFNLFDDDAEKNDTILRKYLNDVASAQNVSEKVKKLLNKTV